MPTLSHRPASPEKVPEKVVVLCADDYGSAEGVGIAIRRLAAAGRLSAVSCLTNGPLWRSEAAKLRSLAGQVEIGLHLNLTLGRALGPMPSLAADGCLPPLPRLIWRSLSGGIDVDEVAAEFDRQIDAFSDGLGGLPDFVDGHEHVHQLPRIRHAVVAVFARRLQPTRAWLRFPAMSWYDLRCHRTALPAASLITLLGFGFRRLAEAQGIDGNRSFRGVRRFRHEPPYASLFAGFLRRIGEGTLIMTHPGLADPSSAVSRHPIAAREEEYAFLASDTFLRLLSRHNLRLGAMEAAGAARGAPGRPQVPPPRNG